MNQRTIENLKVVYDYQKYSYQYFANIYMKPYGFSKKQIKQVKAQWGIK